MRHFVSLLILVAAIVLPSHAIAACTGQCCIEYVVITSFQNNLVCDCECSADTCTYDQTTDIYGWDCGYPALCAGIGIYCCPTGQHAAIETTISDLSCTGLCLITCPCRTEGTTSSGKIKCTTAGSNCCN